MNVLPVKHQDIYAVWDRVEPFIIEGLKYQTDYTAGDVRVYLAEGIWSLMVVVDGSAQPIGAIVVKYYNRPKDRVAFVVAIGGVHISTQEGFDSFRTLLKYNGVTKVEGAARDSVVRLWRTKFGFKEKYKIVEVSL